MTGTPRTNKRNFKNQKSRNPSVTSPPKKYPRKGVNIGRVPQVELSPDDGHSSSFICSNTVCGATLLTTDAFCKRCSCCICKGFGDDKDTTLWLKCADKDSCGLSSHLKCALRSGNIGVSSLEKVMNRDGCYSCVSCGNLSSILGCWKNQLGVAQDGRVVAVLCERVSLCYQLLEGTQKFQELHGIVKDLKMTLETELGPLNEVSPKILRSLWRNLSIAEEVQELLVRGIEKADESLAALSIIQLHHTDIKAPGEESHSRELDLNRDLIPDLNEILPSDTPMVEDYQPPVCPVMESNDAVQQGKKVINQISGSSGASADGKPPVVNFQGLPPTRAETTNGLPLGKSKELGSLDDNFGGCVKEIRRLEQEGYIQEEFRLKFLTWFALRSTEDHKKVVKAFIESFKDDPSSLAGQLDHTFSNLISE